MTSRSYDTRQPEVILAAEHFANYRDVPGAQDIDLRALRTLDAFLDQANARDLESMQCEDFLGFVKGDNSTRRLDNLRTAIDRLTPEASPAREHVRDAIRTKRPRSRICDRRGRDIILANPLMKPYRDITAIAEVALEDLRVLERFLIFADTNRIAVPTVAEFLAFTADVQSSRRLRSLKLALDLLLPGNPGVLLTLQAAILQKDGPRSSRVGEKPRPMAQRRVEPSDLPPEWIGVLGALRSGQMIRRKRPPALSLLDSMEDCLREYAHVQRDAGFDVTLTVEGLRRLEAFCSEASDTVENAPYADYGNRPATRHTRVMRLRQFGEYLGLEPLVLSAFREHEAALRRDLSSVVPLKFAKYTRILGLADTWALVQDLLQQSAMAKRRQTRLRLLNEAAVLALWTFIPLRLRDGQLNWGRDVEYDGENYRIDIETGKEEEPLQGRLITALTPVLDALVLNGMDPAYLEPMRARAMAEELPMFATITGAALSKGYPSTVWRAHMGTGAQISRTRVHSLLGQLGPEGVDAALALCAQRDECSRGFYQDNQVAIALQKRSQQMLDGLMDECMGDDDEDG